MAEFKLGRIRFVWKDIWQPSTQYFVDDVVRFSGSTFICVETHTSNASNDGFAVDFDFDPPRWNQMSTGQVWRGEWDTSTFYNENDIVKYGAAVYIAVQSHESAATIQEGLPADSEKWQVFAEGTRWRDSWETSTLYLAFDIVKYGGYTYICNETHTSASTTTDGLELDQAKWDTFNPGIEFKGDWNPATVRYKINDVVKYGAGLWICINPHTSQNATFESQRSNWEEFVEGISFREDWDVSTEYKQGDVVVYGGNQFLSKTNHTGSIPTQSSTDWALFTQGFNFIEDWNSSTNYRVGDVVRLNSFTYIAVADNSNSEPPSADWEKLNSGLAWQGEWADSIDYKLGDVVKFGANAYICIDAHTSAQDSVNQPDNDVTADFWNVLTVGSETAVLESKGDLVFFSGSGPARLPLGVEGQVLRAGEEFPEWRSLNFVDHVYYVAQDGKDEPAPVNGTTQDKPWKSIRYACDQIANGARNANAKTLLQLNRIFIQREVTEWILYQISEGNGVFDGFTYNEQNFETEIGIVIDRLSSDISKGGNREIRKTIEDYLGIETNGPFTTDLEASGDQVVLAYQFLLDLVLDVLNNNVPDASYQQLNSVANEVDQVIDENLVSETKGINEAESLLTTLINALTTQDSSDIPDRVVMANLLKVATGEFLETLPIIVPEFTCVIGDELRSTTTKAAGSFIDQTDVKYTVETLEHLANVKQDIVQGNSVTPSSGNTETQFDEFPTATATEGNIVNDLVNSVKIRSDWLTNAMVIADLNDPIGYDSGFESARKLLKENKQFFAEETLAFLMQNYPDLRYSKTLAKRDTGFIIDALLYDLTYGGNALSVKAGLAYYGGEGTNIDQIPANIKQETIASLQFLKSRLDDVASNTEITTPLQERIPQFRDTAGSQPALDAIESNIDDIIEIVTDGPDVIGVTVTLVDPTPADGVNSTTDLINAFNALDAEIDNIAAAAVSEINSEFPQLEYDTNKTERDIKIVLKSVGFDFMFDTNYQTVKAAHAYLREVSQGLYKNPVLKEATRFSLDFARSEAILNVNNDADAIERINASFKFIDLTIFGGSNEGSVFETTDENRHIAKLLLERNKEFLSSEIENYIKNTYSSTVTEIEDSGNGTGTIFVTDSTSWLQRNTAIKFTGSVFSVESDVTYFVQNIISSTEFTIATERFATSPTEFTAATGSMNVDLNYNIDLCLRDLNSYIDATKQDLASPGNYFTRFTARYYANAVIGSQEEDMFYFRNACGLRNMSTRGLRGDLTPPDSNGVSTVTAGAYASLDPGWGPEDRRVWITNRSPYVQNISTFGKSCIGQKIDGALHNEGNDSIVSNDFTQVIDSGIGAWVDNNGRAELVSVFTYFQHIGYLCTNGGRIRGTNGNNSYGDFGSMAIGVDETETPVTAVVDNKTQFEATVNTVLTSRGPDGNLLAFEFENAGINYSQIDWFITGGGFGGEVEQDKEFRNLGVYQARLTATAEEGEPGEFGGFGYLTSENNAQSGTTESITLALADQQISSAYIGMRVYVDEGVGVGQFGLIDTYDAASKVATVTRKGKIISAGSFGIGTKYIIDNPGDTDFTQVGAADSESGTIFEASASGSGTGTAIELIPGWEHVVSGSTIAAPTGSSKYIIEPSIEFTSPDFSSTARTLPESSAWTDIEFAESFDYYTGISGTSSESGAGAEFNVVQQTNVYDLTISNGGSNYERLETITIDGSLVGGETTTNDIVITVTSVDESSGAVLAFDFEGSASGGKLVAIAADSQNVITSFDGDSWQIQSSVLLNRSWKSLASGKITEEVTPDELVIGRTYVIETAGDTAWTTVGADSNLPGTVFVATSIDTSGGEQGTAIPFVSSIVAVSADSGVSDIAYSFDNGETWDIPSQLPNGENWNIAYGQGTWVIVSETGSESFFSTDGGETWQPGGTLPTADDWSDISYGAGKFIVIRRNSRSVAISSDGGENWTLEENALPSISNWSVVEYGNNRFIAITAETNTQVAAYSLDGENWNESTLPQEENYTDIVYGQGVFVVVTDSNFAAYSEDGVVWNQNTIVSSTNGFGSIGFSNSSFVSRFVAIDNGLGNEAVEIRAGARAKGRAKVADNSIFAINLLEPGSNYTSTPTMTILDSNVIREAPFQVRVGNGVLATPSFISRGTDYLSAGAGVDRGNGFADFFQPGSFVSVKRLSRLPVAGSNVVFDHLPNRVFKLVNVLNLVGEIDGSQSASLQISPEFEILEAPADETDLSLRIRYSQVRLTGHDFLDIGTGGTATTNYPGIPLIASDATREITEIDGGRVFFTSTDQDGNFRVGELFTVEQSTGIATLDADAFNIAGLQELSLGTVQLGAGSAVITEFSSDPFFTADSDNIIPTQRAVRAYVASQIGGGGSSLNVNSVTAGNIFIGGNTITTVNNESIKINATLDFKKGIRGIPLALNIFLT